MQLEEEEEEDEEEEEEEEEVSLYTSCLVFHLHFSQPTAEIHL